MGKTGSNSNKSNIKISWENKGVSFVKDRYSMYEAIVVYKKVLENKAINRSEDTKKKQKSAEKWKQRNHVI